jgi:hypothetical protein
MHAPTSRRSFLRSSATAAAAVAVGVATAPVASAFDGLGPEGAAVARALAGSSTTLQLARVWVTRETSHLIGEFDDTHNVFDDGSVELLLWPGDQARLAMTGLRFEITVTDLVARDRALREASVGVVSPLDPQPGERLNYRTLDDFNADMRMLAEQNPTICRLLELPMKSLEGRTVYGLEIAEDVDRRDGRPVYYNDGVHHAREWPAAEMPIMWAFDLIESYRRATDPSTPAADRDPHDERMLNIVRNARNVIVPVVNPDGYNYSRSYPVDVPGPVAVGGSYWRKNMRTDGRYGDQPQTPFMPSSHSAYGVDCNRNYSYRWGGDGSSATKSSGTYRGTAPFSEPESLNVAWIHRTYQCVAGITHHTSGDLVLWAWGDTHDDAPDDVLLARLGFASGDYNGYRPTKSIDLYVTTGTCSDYTYGAFGSISYTFEHAGSSFHPPYLTVVPQFYAANREALMLHCELVCLEPDQRGFMYAAVDANPAVKNHLTGDFDETISNTEYTYIGNGLDLTARYNCVITGRLVDADGNGVAGTIRNTKSYSNTLSPNNPIGQEDFPEFWDAEIDTDADGRFRWVVYPSTAPAVEFAGGRETVTITASRAGGTSVSRDIVVSRGTVFDLGTIVV